MKRNIKRFITGFILAVLVLLPTFSMTAFAAEDKLRDVTFDVNKYDTSTDKKAYLSSIKNKFGSANLSVRIDIDDDMSATKTDSYLTEVLEWFGNYEKRIPKIRINGFYSIKPFEKLTDFSVLEELHINRNDHKQPENEDYTGFVDLPNVKILSYTGKNIIEVIKHFPNLTSFSHGFSLTFSQDTNLVKALIKYCKKLNTYQGESFIYNSTYQSIYDEQLRSNIEKGNFKQSDKVGTIKGKFLLTFTGGKNEVLRGKELSEYFSNNVKDRFATGSAACDTYIVVTVVDEYLGNYTDITKDSIYNIYKVNYETKAYSRTYYIQIYDLKNKIAYKKTFITVSHPPSNYIYDKYPPMFLYGEEPTEKLAEYFKKLLADK